MIDVVTAVKNKNGKPPDDIKNIANASVLHIDGYESPSGYSPLPQNVLPSDDINLSHSWLDSYIEFSRKWSPRSYDDYHEAMGIWILSTVAARRVYTNLGKRVYTNIYVLLISKSGQFSKTGAAAIGIELIKDAGLDFLLAPDQSTPQAFMLSMSGKVPSNYGDLSPEKQERVRRRLAFASARGWFYDEFGQHISGMMRENGTMADFRGYLKVIDDTPSKFTYATIVRGESTIHRPYLALSGAMTPADMAQHLGKGSTLWGDGFMARMATVTPPPGAPGSRARYPKGMRNGQAKLVQRLHEWHESLDIPVLDILEVRNPETGKVISYDPEYMPSRDNELICPDEIHDAYYAYNFALLDMVDDENSNIPDDLRSSYIRFHEKALRVAVMLASIDGVKHIELRHWYRAQQIVEGWRAGLHNLYEQSVMGGNGKGNTVNEKILKIVRSKGPLTAREITQKIWALKTTAETQNHLAQLCRDNELIQFRPDGKRTDYYRIPGQDNNIQR